MATALMLQAPLTDDTHTHTHTHSDMEVDLNTADFLFLSVSGQKTVPGVDLNTITDSHTETTNVEILQEFTKLREPVSPEGSQNCPLLVKMSVHYYFFLIMFGRMGAKCVFQVV